MGGVCVADLDPLCGEVLPDWVLLSVVTVPTVSVGDQGQQAPGSGDGHSGGHGGRARQRDGQLHHDLQPGTAGLIGTLGLGQRPYSYTTCTPASVGH